MVLERLRFVLNAMILSKGVLDVVYFVRYIGLKNPVSGDGFATARLSESVCRA